MDKSSGQRVAESDPLAALEMPRKDPRQTEEKASGNVSLTSSDLELVYDGSLQTVGLRFTNLNIPQGAIIQNAWIQFLVDTATSEATSLSIQTQASDDPPTFAATPNDISSRAKSTASVSWAPPAWSILDEAGPDQRTPNLASVMQEVVDRPGWTSGNAMVFLITGTGQRLAKSYDGEVYGAPYLHVEYTLPEPTPTPTPTFTDTPTPTFTPTVTPTPSGPVTILYDYDALYRLTSANHSTGDSYHYTYDAVGNRLTEQTHVQNTTNVYDNANRLASVNGVPYTWDDNGILVNDGTSTYTYDAANRLGSFTNGTASATYSYNGLGDRLTQTVNGVTTNYVLDSASPLTQVLQDGTNTYLYGIDRIAQVNGGIPEYFLTDGLGSVRQLVDSNGAVTLAKSYQPYGIEVSAVGSGVSSYGFTGEIADPTGLTYLRARYYSSESGRFITKDLWQGDHNRPLSLNRWNYVEANPVNYTDPSGHFPTYCQSMPSKGLYELCVLGYYGLEPISYFELGERVQGSQGCYSGPSEYRAPGYLEGVGFWAIIHRFGGEVVYDFATMERTSFAYWGGGVNDSLDIGGGVQAYVGLAAGFRTDDSLSSQYRGVSSSAQVGLSGDIGVGIGGGGGGFISWSDPMLRGVTVYVGGSLSLDVLEIVDLDIVPTVFYFPDNNSRKPYVGSNGEVNKTALFTDILLGDRSPLTIQMNANDTSIYISENHVSALRVWGATMALRYAIAYEELRNENVFP